MRTVRAVAACLCASLIALAQTDRGTITGTVQDQASAMVPGAKVSVRNSETGATSETVTTTTGNFTLAQLPAGTYDLTVEAAGFKKYVGQGTQVQVAQTVRLDIGLEVGSTTESVTVEATAPLLRTENAEHSVNVNGDRINALPLNFGGGAGAIGAVRNQMAFVVLSPGVTGLTPANANNTGTPARVNGLPANTFRVMVEGQDTTSGNTQARVDETQASVEAIEEFSLQTSNFSAEYGQALGGIFNFTVRSGTNHFHGSGYEYFTNEALSAHRPFTGLRPTSRKHDFGGTVGGPVIVPKIYNGLNRTFFFFNWEVFRNVVRGTGALTTVPTDAYRRGDFSAALTGRTLATDGLGRAIPENGIYNPNSNRTVDGRVYRDLFPGNIVPATLLDPVAVKIQSYIPKPVNGDLINNWLQNEPYVKLQSIPAVKIDHNFDQKNKVSFYYSHQRTDLKFGFDSLPLPITATRFQKIYSDTYRLNYDRTVTPTLLLHLGSGFIRYLNPDSSPPEVLNFDAAGQLGFTGSATGTGFPRLEGLSNGNFGGMVLGMGPVNANKYWNDKWTSVASATYVRNNHTYKLGGEMRIDIFTDRNVRFAQGRLEFNRAQTGLPASQGLNLQGGDVGLAYASFLLGATNRSTVNAPQDPQWRKTSWALYIQDTWKATRRLTLDYGLRWDYQDAGHEIWNRSSTFGPGVTNPSAGGMLGGMIYEGTGPGRCNCAFTQKYPYAIGPRLGVAYQITPKTVLRGGWGLAYGNVPGLGYITNQVWYGVGFDARVWESPAVGEAATLMRNGLQYNVGDLFRATLNPGAIPTPGQITPAPPVIIDRNWARPPRVNQWSIAIQREVIRNLAVEVAYVGNRAVWVNSGGNSALFNYNTVTPERLASFGLNVNNAADRSLLTSQIGSSAAQARGLRVPYAGFPSNATVIQALRPFPQFNTILAPRNAPLGTSSYDSLQIKVTKRYSYGLDFTTAYTWSKELELASAFNDVLNRPNQKRIAAAAQPMTLVIGFNYQTPAWKQGRLVSLVTGGWTMGGLLRYTSGVPLAVPNSNNGLNDQLLLPNATVQNRTPGEPLFLKDLNCHCIDPTKELTLNPKAWTDAAAGQWGTSAAGYSDYKAQRFPDEQISFGRMFRIKESMSLQVRAEFFNMFNRMVLPNPVTGNPLATVTRDSQGRITGGFGYIDWRNPNQPRNGQLVARFQW